MIKMRTCSAWHNLKPYDYIVYAQSRKRHLVHTLQCDQRGRWMSSYVVISLLPFRLEQLTIHVAHYSDGARQMCHQLLKDGVSMTGLKHLDMHMDNITDRIPVLGENSSRKLQRYSAEVGGWFHGCDYFCWVVLSTYGWDNLDLHSYFSFVPCNSVPLWCIQTFITDRRSLSKLRIFMSAILTIVHTTLKRISGKKTLTTSPNLLAITAKHHIVFLTGPEYGSCFAGMQYIENILSTICNA